MQDKAEQAITEQIAAAKEAHRAYWVFWAALAQAGVVDTRDTDDYLGEIDEHTAAVVASWVLREPDGLDEAGLSAIATRLALEISREDEQEPGEEADPDAVLAWLDRLENALDREEDEGEEDDEDSE